MQAVLMKEHSLGDTEAALSSTLAVASVGIATLQMLETLLPAAAQEVERESLTLSGHFRTIIDHLRQEQHLPSKVRAAMDGIILGMQFQDRNTQVMENAAGILERYRSLLEEVSGTIERLRAGHAATGETIDQALERILSNIRLSDIRVRYVEALRKANIHSSGDVGDAPASPAGSIELF